MNYYQNCLKRHLYATGKNKSLLTVKQEIQVNSQCKSSHDYSLEKFGLSKHKLYEIMPDVFEFYNFKP